MLLGNQDLCVRFTICLICYVIFTVVQLEFFFEIFACTTDYLDNILILLQYSTLLHIYIGQWILIFVLYELQMFPFEASIHQEEVPVNNSILCKRFTLSSSGMKSIDLTTWLVSTYSTQQLKPATTYSNIVVHYIL